MIRKLGLYLVIAAAAAGLAPTLAQNIDPPAPRHIAYAELVAQRVPVTDLDITDRPYRVIGEVRAEVRKATIFSPSPSQEHVFRELWERAVRLGADAVVNARYGDSRVTAMSWGSRRASGQAVKFLTDAEIAERARVH